MRVLNVDSQASFDNILVTVIGEISNKSEPSRKFLQTFVLAQQPNGYYVLNDIFRYLVEEEEEIVEEAEAIPAAEAPKVAEPAPAVEAQVTDGAAVHKVDEKLEQVANGEVEKPVDVVPQTNGTPIQEEEQAPAPVVDAEILNEVNQTPEPTPAPAPEKEAPVEKEPVAATPAVPKSWASIAKVNAAAAAAAAAAAPAAPAAAPKAAAPVASAPLPASAAAPAAPAAAESRSQEAAPTDASGWQTAGSDHKKTQSRGVEQPVTLGYIKNVTDKVDANALKQALSRFGKINYFDVSRQKVRIFISS